MTINFFGEEARCKICKRTESVLKSAGIEYHIPTDTCYACIKTAKNVSANPAGLSKVSDLIDYTDVELARLKEMERQLLHTLSLVPSAIRVREGGGPEDVAASVTVTFLKAGLLKGS